MTKQESPISFRPSPEDKQIIEALKKKLGLSSTQLFKMGIRKIAEAEGIKIKRA